MRNQITALFTNKTDAEQVLNELRVIGLPDNRLSIITRHGGGQALDTDVPVYEQRNIDGQMVVKGPVDTQVSDDSMIDGVPVIDGPVAEKSEEGLLAGAGIGALFGLAAVFIPGVGPFVAAGAIASAIGTMGVGALAGAVLGAGSGAIAGALTKAGYPESESRYYGEQLERGGVLVSADVDGTEISASQVRRIFSLHAGRTAPVMV